MIPEAAVEAAFRAVWGPNPGNPLDQADAHLLKQLRTALEAAAPHMLAVVSTEEALDALPVGSIVLSDAYRYMVHGGADCGWPISFQRWIGGDWHRGGRSGSTHPDNFLPATVLYRPTP